MAGPVDNRQRLVEMRARLEAAFAPDRLDIVDDSDKHVGHAGARGGAGHFQVHISSRDFAGKRPLARHRMVYAALADMMQRDIHALQIFARTPDE